MNDCLLMIEHSERLMRKAMGIHQVIRIRREPTAVLMDDDGFVRYQRAQITPTKVGGLLGVYDYDTSLCEIKKDLQAWEGWHQAFNATDLQGAA